MDQLANTSEKDQDTIVPVVVKSPPPLRSRLPGPQRLKKRVDARSIPQVTPPLSSPLGHSSSAANDNVSDKHNEEQDLVTKPQSEPTAPITELDVDSPSDRHSVKESLLASQASLRDTLDGKAPTPIDPKAIEYIPTVFRSMDEDTQFWTTYAKEAGEFDKELIDKWHKSLDVLLIFAALFSAINTSFIIESYKGLQPDQSEITNALLRLLLVHRNDALQFSEADLNSLASPAPVVPVNVLFFSSLSCSLAAAFGAVTAKQWLNEYANEGHMLPRHKQGQRRQEKYDGLTNWHFWFLMELLPMLLQISLFLFFAGVVVFLWPMKLEVAAVILAFTVATFAAYIATVIIATIWPNSPFQTPVSGYLRRLVASVTVVVSRGTTWLRMLPVRLKDVPEGMRQFHPIEGIHQIFSGLLHRDEANSLSNPLYSFVSIPKALQAGFNRFTRKSSVGSIVFAEKRSTWEPDDILNAESVMWVLEQAEHPDVTLSALSAIPRLPADLILSLFKERETLFERVLKFHRSLTPIGRGLDVTSWSDSSTISAMVIHHVLKARKKGDETFQGEVTPLPYPAIPEPLPADIDDVAKLIVHFCTNVQSGAAQSDVHFLGRLLERGVSLLSSMQVEIPLSDRHRISPTDSISTSIFPLSLLLDGFIACAAGRLWHGAGTVSYLRHPTSGPVFEKGFGNFVSLLSEGEMSLDIVSHIAIAVAAAQWYGRELNTQIWSYPSEEAQEQFMDSLYNSYVGVDKGKSVLANIALALSVINISDLDYLGLLYPPLLSFAEVLLSDRMDRDVLSYARDTVTVPFPNFAQSLLRVSRGNTNRPETQHRILRILQCCPDDQWLSPMDENYGDVITLLDSVLSLPMTTIPHTTVNATIDLLNRTSDRMTDEAFIQVLVMLPNNLYRHRDRIAQLCEESRGGYEPFEWKLLMLSHPSDEHLTAISDIQVELARSVILRVSDSPGYCEIALRFFDRLMDDNTSLRWPGYFVAADIRLPGNEIATQTERISTLEDRSNGMLSNLRRDRNKRVLWTSEALLLLWHIAISEKRNGRLPVGWDESGFFEERVINKILEGHQNVMEEGYIQDWVPMVEYLRRAWTQPGIQESYLGANLKQILDTLLLIPSSP